jgi:hypothetical protein
MPNPSIRRVSLAFDKAKVTIGKKTDLRTGLSAVASSRRDLWLGCDEGCRLERLTSRGDDTFAAHETFALDGLVTLPAAPGEEADIEGMDVNDGWLWLVGSHSLRRKKAKADDSAEQVASALATVERDGNRHLLARIPLRESTLLPRDGARQAAGIKTTATSSALLDAIRRQKDAHLAPFVSLPGKDNGFDIEGLAVRGTRVLVGLRGPVLREWSCILELQVEADGPLLALEPVDGSAPYRKHFHKLDGLGIRDLLVVDDDVLILAGPTMAHDGPSGIWRWRKGATPGAVRSGSTVEHLVWLPQREGVDRAEGFTLFEGASGPTSVLVVYDTPAADRLKGADTVLADVVRLP